MKAAVGNFCGAEVSPSCVTAIKQAIREATRLALPGLGAAPQTPPKLAAAGLSAPVTRLTVVCIALVGPDTIQAFNKRHAGNNKPTDVLAYPLHYAVKDAPERHFMSHAIYNAARVGGAGRSRGKKGRGGALLLGDVMLCPSVAQAQARQLGHSLDRELAFLAVHGLLHLLGYGHETKRDEDEMTDLQERALSAAGMPRLGAQTP